MRVTFPQQVLEIPSKRRLLSKAGTVQLSRYYYVCKPGPGIHLPCLYYVCEFMIATHVLATECAVYQIGQGLSCPGSRYRVSTASSGHKPGRATSRFPTRPTVQLNRDRPWTSLAEFGTWVHDAMYPGYPNRPLCFHAVRPAHPPGAAVISGHTASFTYIVSEPASFALPSALVTATCRSLSSPVPFLPFNFSLASFIVQHNPRAAHPAVNSWQSQAILPRLLPVPTAAWGPQSSALAHNITAMFPLVDGVSLLSAIGFVVMIVDSRAAMGHQSAYILPSNRPTVPKKLEVH